MNIQALPSGYSLSRNEHGVCAIRIGLEEPLRRMMLASQEKLARMPGARRMPGRARPLSIPIPGTKDRVLVRPYMHGGVLGKLRGRGFSGLGRAFNELIVSARAENLGLPVPRMAGFTGRKLRSGKWHLEAWVLLIPGTRDLPSFLAENELREPGLSDLLGAVARAIRECHDAGLAHPDLNCRNVIVSAARDRYQAYLVDLDKAHFVGRMHVPSRLSQLCRLYRSLAKQNLLPRIISPRDFERFTSAYFSGSFRQKHLDVFMSRCRRAVFWHSLAWKKNRR